MDRETESTMNKFPRKPRQKEDIIEKKVSAIHEDAKEYNLPVAPKAMWDHTLSKLCGECSLVLNLFKPDIENKVAGWRKNIISTVFMEMSVLNVDRL